jgi:branched-chain amino acid transport system ATP-binding protein
VTALLEVAGLHAYYGRAHVLFDLDLQVERGEVVALLGRNGAGKSTTIKAIMGLVTDTAKSKRFDGVDIDALPSYRIGQRGLGYVPEERRVFKRLSVLENLEIGRQKPREGAPTWTPERLFELFPNLAEMRHRLGGQMSGGEQQMLTIARTLMGNPRLILLDEPSEGLAPVIVEQMSRTIAELKREGLSVVLSEQNLAFATGLSDRAYVIDGGRIRFAGTLAELNADEEVREAYLSV